MEILESLKKTIFLEMQAIQKIYQNLNESHLMAVQAILSSTGKVILTGMGKSGHIAKKIAATMNSTGTRAVFLHPAEALHGDLGIAEKNDIVLAISKSGESEELNQTVFALKKMGLKIISITARENSTLAKISDIVLFTPIEREACPLDLAPTASTTVALVLGDALAMTLMQLKNFKTEDFALYHPAGSLGRRLLYYVEDLMIPKEKCPILNPQKTQFVDVLSALSTFGLGIVLFSEDGITLNGILTDGDIRRLVERYGQSVFHIKINEVMNQNYLYTEPQKRAVEVLEFMEKRAKPLNVLPVLKENQQILGIVRLHELVKVA